MTTQILKRAALLPFLMASFVSLAGAKEITFDDPELVPGRGAFSAVVGNVYQVRLTAIHPLQTAYGPREVQSRLEDYQARSQDKKKKYIRKKLVDVAVGPDGGIYLLDGHHMARIMVDAGQPVLLAKVDLVQDQGTLDEFFDRLAKKQDIYLFDGEDPIPVSDLPKRISGLQPDPYRDIAWELQNSGDIEEVDVNFIEFEWARLLFRPSITETELENDYDGAIQKARRLSHSEEAKKLFKGKGYIEK